jgi:subtilisin family serine protease
LLGAIATGCTVVLPVRPAGAQPTTWNFALAQIPAAQGPGRDGAGVTVAVVDTWVDPNHPDFGGRVFDEAYCVGQNGSCLDHRYAPDACVHGTHVAGTVASATYGVAPAARILAVQVLSYDPSDGECSGSTADVATGISWAVAHGARVINLSLGDLVPGLFQAPEVTTAIHDAAQAGAVVVVAAGNDSLPLTDNYGGDALLVAATGPSGQLASYSDRDGSVALAAPGGDDGSAGLAACTPSDCVLSTEPHASYGLLEGTSMAAPHVSGTAALLLAQDPGRGRAGVIQALESTARPLAGAGHGEIDAAAALALYRTASTATGHVSTTAPGTTPSGTSSVATPAHRSIPLTRVSSSPPGRPQRSRVSATGPSRRSAGVPAATGSTSPHGSPGSDLAIGIVAAVMLAAVVGGLAARVAQRSKSAVKS